jgi:3-oxoacyl-[acyl-carrier-protein] synthase-3
MGKIGAIKNTALPKHPMKNARTNQHASLSPRVVGSGICFPDNKVTADEVDRLCGLPSGSTLQRTGVVERYFVRGETAAAMGARALQEATGGVRPDLLISAGGTPQQIIPSTASLIAAEMGWGGIAAFDVNASCMGFVVAMKLVQSLFCSEQYATIAIVCSDISSGGINWKDVESAGILGDGAGAVFLQPGEGEFRSRIECWPQGVGMTRVRGGGTELPASKMNDSNKEEYLFYMDGPKVFRLAAKILDDLVVNLVGARGDRWDSIDAVVPHQASPLALRHMSRRLGVPQEKLVSVVERCGNTIAAGIPIALHTAMASGQISSGDTVALIGTGAGLLAGGLILTV